MLKLTELNSQLTWETNRRPELHEKSGLKIGSVVIDCINFDKMLAFWQEALHYVPRGLLRVAG